ncbi:MAG: hypothetical protein QXQ53_05680 [Candidatus Methanosuratincola sp.]
MIARLTIKAPSKSIARKYISERIGPYRPQILWEEVGLFEETHVTVSVNPEAKPALVAWYNDFNLPMKEGTLILFSIPYEL